VAIYTPLASGKQAAGDKVSLKLFLCARRLSAEASAKAGVSAVNAIPHMCAQNSSESATFPHRQKQAIS
jgi:hypothetical protein